MDGMRFQIMSQILIRVIALQPTNVGLLAIGINDVRERLVLTRLLNQGNTPVLFPSIETVIDRIRETPLNILIDVDVVDSEILQEIGRAELFTSHRLFFIVSERPDNAISTMQNLSLYVNSNVKLVDIANWKDVVGFQANVYDVYNNGRIYGGRLRWVLEQVISFEKGEIVAVLNTNEGSNVKRYDWSDLTLPVAMVSSRWSEEMDENEFLEWYESNRDFQDSTPRYGFQVQRVLQEFLKYK